MRHLNSSPGFTISELIITVALIGMLLVPIIGGIFNFYSELLFNDRQAALDLTTQTMLSKITEDVRSASGVKAASTITDPHKSGGWQTSSSNHVLVITTPALNSNNSFIIDPSTNRPYQNEIVFFATNKNFYRRSLPNPLATGNSMSRSCPDSAVSASCPADILLHTKFESSSFVFYDFNGSETTTFANIRSAKISVSVTDMVNSRPITATHSTRVTLRNI